MKHQSTALVKGEPPTPPGWPLAQAMLLQTRFHTGLFWKSDCKAGVAFFYRTGEPVRRNSPKQYREKKEREKKSLKRKQAVATGKHISLKTPQEVMLL